MISNGYFGFSKNPFGFWNFIFVRISKIFKMKTEIESDSWVRTDLKRLKFLDKNPKKVIIIPNRVVNFVI